MALINNIKKAQKVIIYWDYENCPIPTQATSFGNVYDAIKRKIFAYLQYEVQAETRVYIAAHKIPNKIKQEMDICSVKNIDIPSWKPAAVDKRILVDLALDLYDWSKNSNIRNVVCLISGDKDFGNILGRVHNCPEIAKLILIRLPRDDGMELPINKTLYSCVDYVIDANNGTGFVVEEFIDCKHGIKCNRSEGECTFYHHQSHYVKKKNGNLENPHLDNDDFKMDKQLKKVRARMPCKFGDICKNWKKGRCHFYHAAPYKGPYHKPCRNGDQCKDWKNGVCPYIHRPQPNEIQHSQIQQHQLQFVQQQQSRPNDNNGNMNNGNVNMNSSYSSF